jgi:hypothetical protein
VVTWRDYYVEQCRRSEMLEFAARKGRYRLAGRRSGRQVGWFQVGVVRTGAWLEALGRRMQAGHAPEPSPEAPIKPLAGKMIESC